MSNSVVMALTNFGRTLEDSSVEAQTKLHVLGTLNEVSLTLNELSESGVGRSVNKLKSEPGELGTTARLLITKWKRLLHEHLATQSIPIPKSQREPDLAPSEVASKTRAQTDTTVRRPLPLKTETSTASEGHPDSRLARTDQLPRKSSKSVSSSNEKSPVSIKESNTSATCGKRSRKRKSSDIPESLDSSCGLSFMESLNVASSSVHRSARRKKSKTFNGSQKFLDHSAILQPAMAKPTPGFTQEVLSALNEDFDRPDIIHRPTKQTAPPADSDLVDDGDLKFKSKKILWVPKPSRSAFASTLAHETGGDLSGTCVLSHTPQSLVDLCLDTLERNLTRVDHVGNVPYELIARVLQHASAEDLARIEHCNPQYTGCSDGLWLRHIQRKFATMLQSTNPSPRPGETWLELYERLTHEEADRLNRIINQSTRRMQEEQKSHRTTITTEAIMPRDVRRRMGRHTGPTSSASSSHSSSHATGKRVSPTRPVFKPYNVSHPAPPTRPTAHSVADAPRTTDPPHSGNGSSRGGLLDKLRKQFGLARRLR